MDVLGFQEVEVLLRQSRILGLRIVGAIAQLHVVVEHKLEMYIAEAALDQQSQIVFALVQNQHHRKHAIHNHVAVGH